MKIPKIKDVRYTLNFIEPVIIDQHRIHLPAQFYLEGIKSFASKEPCSKIKATYICSSIDLRPLTQCMQQLVSGKAADCPLEHTYGNKTIRKINDGNIVVNAINVTLTSNCSVTKRTLTGSFLIQYANCTIKLDEEEFSNVNTEIRPFIPTTGQKVHPTRFLNHIPLEHLQELHLEQRNRIENLNLTTENIHWRLNIFGWITSVTSTILIVSIVVSSLTIIWKLIWKGLCTTTLEVTRQTSNAATASYPESRDIPLIPQQ